MNKMLQETAEDYDVIYYKILSIYIIAFVCTLDGFHPKYEFCLYVFLYEFHEPNLL